MRFCPVVLLMLLCNGAIAEENVQTSTSATIATSTTTSSAYETNVFHATVPAPPIYTKLWWSHNTSTTVGYWYTKDQVVRINAQMEYLTDHAARECFDSTTKDEEQFLKSIPGVVIVAGSALIIGFFAGYEVARRF